MKKILYFFTLLFSMTLSAQDGTIDTSFNPMDMGINSGFNNAVNDMKKQPDGKILVGGMFTSYNSVVANKMVRINQDGTLDNSFTFSSGIIERGIRKIALQSDGKILIITGSPNTTSSELMRLNSDGSKDNTFSSYYGGSLFSIWVLDDGRIMIGGLFSIYNQFSKNIVRLNPDGSLDSTFQANARTDYRVNTIAVQTDGKILIGGEFTSYNNVSRNRIARLNTDGSLDTSFVVGTGFDGKAVYSVAIDISGKILVCGDFSKYNETSTGQRLIRLNADGSLDNTFATFANEYRIFTSVFPQSDGKIYVSKGNDLYGTPSSANFYRLNADGSLDNTFEIGNEDYNIFYNYDHNFGTMVLTSDNKIMIGGFFHNYNGTTENNIALVDKDGKLDKTFNPQTGADSDIQNMALRPNKKILIMGDYFSYNGIPNSSYQLFEDGSVDSSYILGPSQSDPKYSKVSYNSVFQSDGKIIVFGQQDYIFPNGVVRKKIARLNADENLDPTFAPNPSDFGYIKKVLVQPDGKILTVSETYPSKLIRLNVDGSVDYSFNTNMQYFTVYDIILLPNGKFLIGGTYNNQASVILLNSDGTQDTTFISKTDSSSLRVHVLKLQPDGKILVGGDFSSYNGVTVKGLVRIKADGTLDTTFNSGLGTFISWLPLYLQPDGKILACSSYYNIVKLNSDGSLDPTFNIGSGFNGFITSMILQPDGKILVAGDFTSYNGIGKNRILRLNNTISLSTVDISKKQIVIYPNPVKDILNIKTDEPISGYEIYSLDGRKLTTENNVNNFKVDVSHLTKGDYLIKIKSKGKEQTAKFIKQ